jgi:hypothetical protein
VGQHSCLAFDDRVGQPDDRDQALRPTDHDGKCFDQNLWAIVAGFDETSPLASDAKRSDTHPPAN